ncbi:hypothetical protein HOG16_04710 [Candidatus Woesearchaeota archaeon]|jgi:hypothetical protein|nr:hypothetical protein [Candidatus Woesearchaeota archaeon]MBT4321711.1 hypothetical protein [Candidatus Woesearchaeota archaeon]MBT4631197.1 hypothetical protein [Candidatus Woesearchaeota archaeon]
MHPLEYYARKEIQIMLVDSALSREVAVRLGDKGFGKRPDTLNYESDVLELAKQGATSFHVSEEHWQNPRNLVPGMTKRQLDELRTGWDFILDIDSPELENSKLITHFLIQALKFHNIKNVSVKFSGNKGFHIGVPFRSFPKVFNEEKTKTLFPESPRIMAEYLTDMIREHLSERIKGGDIDEILKVDTVLISSRHLYRAPYSLHEKSGLASVPIDPERVLEFDKKEAIPESVIPKLKFLDGLEENDASQLIKSAHEWDSEISIRKKAFEEEKKEVVREYDEISEAIPEEFFPDEIKLGLKGLEDGKKRFLFILINFLKSVGWNHEELSKKIKEWNKNNPEPLKEGYIISQLLWHKRQKEKILPPNYSNNDYYKDLGLNPRESVQRKFKNPVTYTLTMYRIKHKKKK